jgi:hypothetical protein
MCAILWKSAAFTLELPSGRRWLLPGAALAATLDFRQDRLAAKFVLEGEIFDRGAMRESG